MPRLAQAASFRKGEQRETKLNAPSAEALALPFYNLLPKDPVGLMKWRIYARERAIDDLEFRGALLQMAEKDVAFFATTFCWIHETRGREAKSFPIDLWEDQVDVLAWLAQELGMRDILVEKSRGIGLSWLCCILSIWAWLYGDTEEIAFVSKDDSSLDIKDRPSTLMGKLDFLFAHLPAWMREDENGKSILKRTASSTHKFENLSNGASILGFVPTNNKLRSGRYRYVFFDEFAFLERTDMERLMAASQHTTFCRMYVSTHNGTGLFYYLSRDTETTLFKIRTFWWANPDRYAGAYKSDKGRIDFLDGSYNYDAEYQYIADGLLRSPWFDAELERAGAALQATLEELNGIAAISTRKLFRPHVLEVANMRAKPPIRSGNFTDIGTYEDDLDGDFLWWVIPGTLMGPFVVGADPAQGLPGGDYSALAVIDIPTGQIICTAALTLIPPPVFAATAIHLARYLVGERGDGWAQIAYETTGAVGASFGEELKRQNYGGIWKNDGDKVGYQNPDANESILHELSRAIYAQEITVYDENAIAEFQFYEYNVKTGQQGTKRYVLDWMGQDGHGDRSTAIAISWLAAKRRRSVFLDMPEHKPPERCTIEDEPLLRRAKRLEADQLWSYQYEEAFIA